LLYAERPVPRLADRGPTALLTDFGHTPGDLDFIEFMSERPKLEG